MATLLLKKSYRHKDLKEIKFHDLWNSYGVFTTMRVVGKPVKILFKCSTHYTKVRIKGIFSQACDVCRAKRVKRSIRNVHR